jgi:rare lipoprotein A (peptidoglycan hydrolase)
MEGLRRILSTFVFDFFVYISRFMFYLGVCLFIIHHLNNHFGDGIVIGASRNFAKMSAQPMLSPKISGFVGQLTSFSTLRSKVILGNLPRERKTRLQKKIQQGKASFYGKRWNGRKTASGEVFDCEKFTAAHKKLPFGTYAKVVRKDNGKTVVVRINDRGPFVKGRVIDLSSAAAKQIDMLKEGVTDVTLYKATVADYLKQFMDGLQIPTGHP